MARLAPPIVVWMATRAVLLLLVFKVFVLPGPDVTFDIEVIYSGWSEILRTGSFPLGDVSWQYPPAAALPILSPVLLPFLGYAQAFFVLAWVADAAAFTLLLAAGRRPDSSLFGAWFWVVGVPLLGPTVYARYDLMVTAVAIAALLALRRRPALAGALAGFGAMLKVWPVLLLLGTTRGRVTRIAWGAAIACALVVGTVFAAAMPGAFDFLTAQRDRGTEVESLGALVFHIARHYGWDGTVALSYGSMEFLGPYVDVVSAAAPVLSVLAMAWLVWWRVRARELTFTTACAAAFVAVLLFTTTSRVISPQYMIWLVGLAAVCLAVRARRQLLPAMLVLAATAVTLLEFPVFFDEVVGSTGFGIALMVVRNGLLVGASVVAGRRLWRDTVTEPRRALTDQLVQKPGELAGRVVGEAGVGRPGLDHGAPRRR